MIETKNILYCYTNNFLSEMDLLSFLDNLLCKIPSSDISLDEIHEICKKHFLLNKLKHSTDLDFVLLTFKQIIYKLKKPENLFDIALYFTKKLAEPTLHLLLIEEYFEIADIDHCEELFCYIENRQEFITEGLEPSKGKSLILLRLCNELLRRIDNVHKAYFAGRVMMFIAFVFPLSERSGVNLKGDFNSIDFNIEIQDEQNDFYNTFWNLQKFLAEPLLIFSSMVSYNTFKNQVERVLVEFNRLGIEYTDDFADIDENSFFFPRPLTNRNVFESQLETWTFRCEYIIQILIVLQFANSFSPAEKEKSKTESQLNKFVQYPFVLNQSQENWVIDMRIKFMDLVRFTNRDASKTITTILSHEKNWVKWKGENCPKFDMENMIIEEYIDPEMIDSKAIINDTISLGDVALTNLWNSTKNLKEILKNHKKIENISEYLVPLIEQLDANGNIEEGIEKEYLYSKDDLFNWKAYRIAVKECIHNVTKVDGIDCIGLIKTMKLGHVSCINNQQNESMLLMGTDENIDQPRKLSSNSIPDSIDVEMEAGEVLE